MINGKMLKSAMISGANNIALHKKEVNELNVFPVPDGDTGTNMSMTIQSGAREISKRSDNAGVDEISKTMASALLRGARGNSGVILSLLFRGFSKGLEGKAELSGKDLATALTLGVEAAYKAVMNPTEGTILTVARVAAEQAEKLIEEDEDASETDVWDLICETATKTLATTPDLLPVLKKAGVVDAGGKGLIYVFEGMKQVFDGGEMVEWKNEETSAVAHVGHDTERMQNAAGTVEADIQFGYCTEFIVNRENGDDPIKLRAYLETIGDSVVVVDDDDIIKVHLHTNEPGNALQKALTFGALTNMKIDNMREQHTSILQEMEQTKASLTYVPVEDGVKYGFVSICAGKGIEALFNDLGVTQIVSGGQTMNPSTDDILEAVHAVPAETVFVLPNNKNIIMAAEQVVSLADRKVVVVPTTTIPQGISAMLAFDSGIEALENEHAMKEAALRVSTGQLTFAARNSEFEGFKIKKGEILAMENGKLSFVDTKLEHAAVKLVRTMAKKKASFVTIIHGEDVSEFEANELYDVVKAKLPKDVEVILVNGGQPVYYYIISVE